MIGVRRAPRLWTPFPAQHHRHRKMLELLKRHGASGPHAFSVLLGEAAAGLHGSESRGVAELSWDEFARFAGIEPEMSRHRLVELVEEPFTLIEIEDEDALGFRVRLVSWAEWDQRPKSGAERQRDYRGRQKGQQMSDADFAARMGMV